MRLSFSLTFAASARKVEGEGHPFRCPALQGACRAGGGGRVSSASTCGVSAARGRGSASQLGPGLALQVTKPGFICEFKNRPIWSSFCESEHFCFLHSFIPHFLTSPRWFLGGGKGSERPADWIEAGEDDRGVSQVAQNAGGTLVGYPSSPTGRGRWPCLAPTLRPFCFLPSGLSG